MFAPGNKTYQKLGNKRVICIMKDSLLINRRSFLQFAFNTVEKLEVFADFNFVHLN